MNTPTTQQNATEIFRKYYKPLEPILKKPKNRVYTTTVLSFLTVSLFIWYAIRPTIQTILSLRREIRDSTIVNEQMETKISALVEGQAAYQEITPRIGLLKEAVPETPEMVQLMIQLRDLANAVDATVSAANINAIPLTVEKLKTANISVSPTPTLALGAPTPSVSPITNNTISALTITVDGPYDSIKQFVLGIYTLRRIVTIVDMSLVPHASEQNKIGTSLVMTVKLNSYSSGSE